MINNSKAPINRDLGEILALFISVTTPTKKRVSKTNVTIDENGIVDDKYYKKDNNRSILLSSNKSYEMIHNEGITAKYGELGENIVVSFNPYDLELGTKIKMGDCILEITEHCTICNSLKKIDDCIPTLLKNDRGVFVKVISGGVLSVKDQIEVISNQ